MEDVANGVPENDDIASDGYVPVMKHVLVGRGKCGVRSRENGVSVWQKKVRVGRIRGYGSFLEAVWKPMGHVDVFKPGFYIAV